MHTLYYAHIALHTSLCTLHCMHALYALQPCISLVYLAQQIAILLYRWSVAKMQCYSLGCIDLANIVFSSTQTVMMLPI